jgi:hypothetical protein
VLEHAPLVREALAERLIIFGLGELQLLPPHAAAHGAAWLAHGWHERLAPQYEWVERVAL